MAAIHRSRAGHWQHHFAIVVVFVSSMAASVRHYPFGGAEFSLADQRSRALHRSAAYPVLRGGTAVIDHTLYWAGVREEEEAHYLAAILTSDAARQRVAGMQAKGQWGARHFDKVMFELPIPKFDPAAPIHRELSASGARAEAVAATVDLGSVGFVAVRGRVRDALRADGVAGKIDALVAQLLDG